MQNSSQTDWESVNRLSDDDIDFSEIPETTEGFWKDPEWFMPSIKDRFINVLWRYQHKSPDVKILILIWWLKPPAIRFYPSGVIFTLIRDEPQFIATPRVFVLTFQPFHPMAGWSFFED